MVWIVDGKEIIPLFVLPTDSTGLMIGIVQFLAAVILIVIFERIWIKRFRDRKGGLEWHIHRILLWEFGTLVALIGSYIFTLYYVILPLLFLLAFLSMWYLVRVLGRE